METMRVRILVYVCALMSCDVQAHAIVKDSGEQSALQEALLLVELLKSEYARVLRESNRIKGTEVDEKDLQTCTTTTVPTDAMRRHEHKTHGRLRYGQRSPQVANSFYYDFPRRRFNTYRDYYGSYGPPKSWRRMDYENIFGPQPGHTLPTATINQSTIVSVTDIAISSLLTPTSTTVSAITTSNTLSHTSSSSTMLPTTVSSTSPKPVTVSLITFKSTELLLPTNLTSTTFRTSISSTIPSSTFLIKNRPILTSNSIQSVPSVVNTVKNKRPQTKKLTVSGKVKLLQKKLLLSLEKTTLIPTNENPEQAQVAAELENELEAGIDSSSTFPSSRRWSITWRPSKRVHLARSTPYHIPLPENHAFCYTNPRSSLCRTFIK